MVVVAALALTACGSSNKSGGSTNTADSPSTGSGSGLTGTPIKIGYIASESGPQAQNGIAAAGVAHAWQAYTNAHGGILGHPVDIVMTDSQNTVPGATSAAKSFLADSSIDAIMMTDLVAEGALNSTFANTPVAVLSGGGSSDIFWSHVPGAFQDVSGSDYTIKAYVDQAKAGGATKFGWAACAEVAVCAANGGIAMKYASSIGLQAEGVQQFSASASDYTAQCLAFIDKGTDSIAFNIGYPVGQRVATNCIQQGYKGAFSVMNSGFDQKTFSGVSGFKGVGSSNGFPWWSTNPAVQTYVSAMKQYSPSTTYSSGNSTSIWSTFELLKKALENTKPTTINRQTVMDAMYSIKNETLGGLLPQPITYTKGKPSTPVGCSWFFKFNAGDANPTSIAPAKSGNGASGDLASTCAGYLPASNYGG